MALTEAVERIMESVVLNRVTSGLMYFRATKTGTLKNVYLYRSAAGGITGTWYFNLIHNGAGLWSGSGRLAFNLGTSLASKTALSVAVTKGDVFYLDLEQNGGGAITGNLVLLLDIETSESFVESVVAGAGVDVDNTDPANPEVSLLADLDDLDDVDTTGAVDGDALVYDSGIWVPGAGASSPGGIYSPDKPYSSPNAMDDEFPGPTLDPKWTVENVTPTTNFNIPNHVGFTGATAAQISGILQATTNVDQIFRLKVVPPQDISASNLTMGFLLKRSGGYTELGYLTGQQKCFTWTWTSVSVNSAFVDLGLRFANPGHVRPFYLECRYVASGTTYQLFFSLDGINFFSLASPVSLGGALTHIGISMRGGSGVTGYYDWFRKLQGSYTGGNL